MKTVYKMEAIIKSWLQIEDTLYHGKLTILCQVTGKTYTIDNCNEQCMLNVFFSHNQQDTHIFLGTYTHIHAFLNEYKDNLRQSFPNINTRNKSRRSYEEYLTN